MGHGHFDGIFIAVAIQGQESHAEGLGRNAVGVNGSEVHLVYEAVTDDVGHTAAGTVAMGSLGYVQDDDAFDVRR